MVTFYFVPMRLLGQHGWKIAAALMDSYIGGVVNYVAISKALGVSPSAVAVGAATDNVICAIYFLILFALASKVPLVASKLTAGTATDGCEGSNVDGQFSLIETAAAAAVICYMQVSHLDY